MAAALDQIRRRIARRLPAHVVRTLAGVIEDVRSIPARATRSERWKDPLQTLHHVGGGDYHEIGKAVFDQLCEHAYLKPDFHVLDIGCGTGRVASHLSRFLSSEGRYTGFDVARKAVMMCRRRFKTHSAHFKFVHAEVKNGDYNHLGSLKADSYRFPIPDTSVDLVFATSVYSHMPLSEIRHYLCESSRVLKPQGAVFFTAYLLDNERRTRVARRSTTPLTDWDDGSMVADPTTPERLIAHDQTRMVALVQAAGLYDVQVLRGSWEGASNYSGWQDAVVARKLGPSSETIATVSLKG